MIFHIRVEQGRCQSGWKMRPSNSNYRKNAKGGLYLLDGHCLNAMVDDGINRRSRCWVPKRNTNCKCVHPTSIYKHNNMSVSLWNTQKNVGFHKSLTHTESFRLT